ncbi:calmodulin-like protein 4 isoform X2 [Lepeophtheirus salmonis]|uniref:Calmodulin n=1 Tax=Lepeophtheirus salmonis TaxID=72036 RepID=D3PIX0_LEPSM|nr:calmodulin-like protein 4 isoform X2 [Lepeophtheirus salmonis]ADD38506.1 Calmodulin [Lepeophtheirus salmonis]
MARYFKEQDIDEYRECFYLYSRSGLINTVDELGLIMRSLGMSPTLLELKEYMKAKNGKMNFADFLEVVHKHSSKEDIPKEILDAFRDMDVKKKKTILGKDLKHILMDWGEKLTTQEVCIIFTFSHLNI